MPRDLSGNYSRVNPPGAAGYQFNTDIDQNQVNAEINDIGTELTNSIDASGKKTATGNLPMGGFVHSGLGMADADGETVRFQSLKKGSDIAVTASGTVAIPAEGALFNLTAASAFNVTGFTGGYDGRTYSVRFNPDKLLTLVNSSTFKLLGGATRITRAGEILRFTQESSGVIAEIGQQPVIDMTGYSGADVALGVGQTALYTVAAASSLLLRIATATEQGYEIEYNANNNTGVTLGANANLQVNNANFGTNVCANVRNDIDGTSLVTSVGTSNNNFILTTVGRAHWFKSKVFTRTTGKAMQTDYFLSTATLTYSGNHRSRCTDTTTVWTSLGTINFQEAVTGLVTVKRTF